MSSFAFGENSDVRYVISVGANLGSAQLLVADAIDGMAVRLDGELVAASSLYRTSPVSDIEQPDYINAVAIVDSPLEPIEALRVLQSMEDRADRVREIRWGPRTLDLDIVTVDGIVSDDPNLTLPHPSAHERAFVLIPWLEIDADAALPGRGLVRDIVGAGFEGQEIQRVDFR